MAYGAVPDAARGHVAVLRCPRRLVRRRLAVVHTFTATAPTATAPTAAAAASRLTGTSTTAAYSWHDLETRPRAARRLRSSAWRDPERQRHCPQGRKRVVLPLGCCCGRERPRQQGRTRSVLSFGSSHLGAGASDIVCCSRRRSNSSRPRVCPRQRRSRWKTQRHLPGGE